jgi:membrane-bound lytic murein transglycosylase A
LEAGYSIAVDPKFVPLGAPVFLATTYPLSPQPLERLAMAQDTGGAIRGALRADFFWGSGAQAGELAGRMRQPGRLWVLWPRGAPLPRPLP